MTAAIFLATLRLNRLNSTAWAASIVIYAGIIVAIFPSIRGIVEVEGYIEALPKEFLAVVGLEDTTNLFADGFMTFQGLLSADYFSLWLILLTIYGVMSGGSLASRDLERGSLDLLLSHPIGRRRLLLAKLGAHAAVLIGLAALSTLTIGLGGVLVNAKLSFSNVAATHGIAISLVLAILAYSTFFSAWFLSSGKAMVIAGILTLLMYALNIVGNVVETMGAIKYISLFHYFDAFSTLNSGSIDAMGLGLYISVAILFGIGALYVFERRDLFN